MPQYNKLFFVIDKVTKLESLKKYLSNKKKEMNVNANVLINLPTKTYTLNLVCKLSQNSFKTNMIPIISSVFKSNVQDSIEIA